MKFRSSIKSTLLKRTLFQGSFKALIGICFLVTGGAFLPVDLLYRWGFSIFLIGFGWITWGLYPYKKLLRLEANPNELIQDEKGLTYFQKGQPIFFIPSASIEHFSYYQGKKEYGILVKIFKSPKEKGIFYTTSLTNLRSPKGILNDEETRLFLRYFTRRTFEDVVEINEKL